MQSDTITGQSASLLKRFFDSAAGKRVVEEDAAAVAAERQRVASLMAKTAADAAAENENFAKAHGKAQAARDAAHVAFQKADRHVRSQHADHAAQAWLASNKLDACRRALEATASPLIHDFIESVMKQIDDARKTGAHSVPVESREVIYGIRPFIFVTTGASLSIALDAAREILAEARELLLEPDQVKAIAQLEGLRARLPNFAELELTEWAMTPPRLLPAEKAAE